MVTATVLKPTKFQPLEVVDAKTLDEAAENLLKRGWTRLTCPTMPQRFERVISAFVPLTEDPNRDEYKIDARREFADGQSELGLLETTRGKLKSKPRPDEIAEGRVREDETKYKFQFNNRLPGYYSRKGLIERHVSFFSEVAQLHGEALLLGLEVAEKLDQEMPNYGFLERMFTGEHGAMTRLLRYMCDGEQPGIAQRHRDRDFLTIHVRSDRPGLWLADKNDVIVPDACETRTNSVLMFFGRKAWEITHGKIRGIVHGVTDTTFKDKLRFPRHTIVTFLHAAVSAEEDAWGKTHVHELNLLPHVDKYGL